MKDRHISLGKTFWEFGRTFRTETVNSGGNFEAARRHLETGSILLYSNHFSMFDSLLFARLVAKELTPLSNVRFVASIRQFDHARGKFAQIQDLVREGIEKDLGAKAILVVQDKDMNSYGDGQFINRKAVMAAIRTLRTPGKVLAIAPEGQRSRTGGLIKAEEGLETIFRLAGDHAKALPIAMPNSTLAPFIGKHTLTVGSPFSYADIEAQQRQSPGTSVTDLMMRRLAAILPPPNRGHYLLG